VCGITMSVCILLIAVYVFLPDSAETILKPYKIVFWLETAAIWAFGISWLVKGETLLRDKG
jgi:hypothetical protein